MIQRDQEGEKNVPVGRFFVGEPYQGVPPQGAALQKRTNNNRASESKRYSLFRSAVFIWWEVGAGLRPAGNPLIGFPSVRQPTGLSDLPFLIFWDQ